MTKVYKIQDEKGTFVANSWSTSKFGKIWSATRFVVEHIRHSRRYNDIRGANSYVVEYDLVEKKRTPVKEFLLQEQSRIAERRYAREAERRAYLESKKRTELVTPLLELVRKIEAGENVDSEVTSLLNRVAKAC